MVTTNMGPFVVASLVAFVPLILFGGIGYVIYMATMMPSIMANKNPDIGAMLAAQGLMYLLIFIGQALAGPGFVSIARLAVKCYRMEPVSNEDALWGWKNRLGPSIVLGIVVQIGSALGAIACGIGQLVTGGMLSGAYAAYVEGDEIAPMDAVTRSWETFKPHWLNVAGVFLVASMLSGVGAMACYIGIVVTYPMLIASMTHAYLNQRYPVIPPPGSMPIEYPAP
jgi:hypothetical protein